MSNVVEFPKKNRDKEVLNDRIDLLLETPSGDFRADILEEISRLNISDEVFETEYLRMEPDSADVITLDDYR